MWIIRAINCIQNELQFSCGKLSSFSQGNAGKSVQMKKVKQKPRDGMGGGGGSKLSLMKRTNYVLNTFKTASNAIHQSIWLKTTEMPSIDLSS